MHVTTKDVDKDGVHILTSVIEADGASALVSAKGKLEADVIGVKRTASGGIEVQTAIKVIEPPVAAPEPPKAEAAPSPDSIAVAFLVSKGHKKEAAVEQVRKYGVQRVLALRDKELDGELAAAVAEKPAK